MKKHILPAVVMTVLCLLFFSGAYTTVVWAVAQAAPGAGKGETVQANGRTVGYKNIGQSFTEDRYFNGRPSAVDYNAAGSGGSNKGPTNPDYLLTVQQRLDTFLAHNPGITAKQIPVELVTASGSGLDPNISPEAALVQVPRIARARNVPEETVRELVQAQTGKSPVLLGGPRKVNVLQLNIALDREQHKNQ